MNFEIFGIVMPMWVYIIVFTVCQFINVGLNTAKTIIMHKEEKISSSIINAITFGFYAIIVVMTASALPLWITILITFATNLFGVYGSMWLLDRFKKDSLWEIVATVQGVDNLQYLMLSFAIDRISYNYIETNKQNEYIFHIYSENQKQSAFIKKELDEVNAKYIVHEERAKL
jgi:hypothetical protein